MRTKTSTLALESLLAALVVLAASGCAHYWERPGGVVADFERESAACIEDAKQSPYGPASLEPVYRACMRSKGWKRIEVSVADTKDFLKPPSPLSGKRYYQNR
jgi:ribosomal protein L14